MTLWSVSRWQVDRKLNWNVCGCLSDSSSECTSFSYYFWSLLLSLFQFISLSYFYAIKQLNKWSSQALYTVSRLLNAWWVLKPETQWLFLFYHQLLYAADKISCFHIAFMCPSDSKFFTHVFQKYKNVFHGCDCQTSSYLAIHFRVFLHSDKWLPVYWGIVFCSMLILLNPLHATQVLCIYRENRINTQLFMEKKQFIALSSQLFVSGQNIVWRMLLYVFYERILHFFHHHLLLI